MNKKESLLTQERLKELLEYEPETGLFTRLVTVGSTAQKGKIAGSKNSAGYLTIQIDGYAYYCHRLVWLYIYAKWPEPLIDHINNIRHDNRLCNLREATHLENRINSTNIDYKTHLCICGKEITVKRKHCSQKCNLKSKERVDWEDSKEELMYLREHEKLSYVNIGIYYGVSGKTISKWYNRFKAL